MMRVPLRLSGGDGVRCQGWPVTQALAAEDPPA
jgi:hypothetical protein